MLTALFGIDDGSLNLAVNLLILVLVVVWIALVWWTYADARRRLDDPVLIATATAASLFPFIGTAIYSILRPPEFLADARERELETKSAELRLRRLAETSCPRCEHPIELSWLRCPECQHRLKDPCHSCGRPVDPRWAICPHCETPVAGSSSGEGRQRQRSSRSGERPPSRQRPSGERAKGQRRAEPKRATRPKQRSSESSGSSSRSSSESSGSSSRTKSSSKPSSSSRPKPAAEDRPQRDDGDEPTRPQRRKPTSKT